MLRDTKQRSAPVLVRRWALRCGGGLLLGAGACAAAAGTAHADSGLQTTDLGSQARSAVESLLPASGKVAPVSKPNPKPATKIVKVTPPAQPAGKHRAPAATAKHLVGDTVGTVAKVSGKLREVVEPAGHARKAHPAPGTRGGVVRDHPATPRIPEVAPPSTVRAPLIQLPTSPRLPDLHGTPRTLPGSGRLGSRLPQLDLADLLAGVGQELLPALGLPAVDLPTVDLPALTALPVLRLPELPGLRVLPAVPALPALPVLQLPGAAGPGTTLVADLGGTPTTSQGPAGTASRHLSRVALPDAPSAPAAPRGPLPTGPVPALPAGTGAGATFHPTTPWTEPAARAGLTPSGRGTLLTGFAGPAPRDRAGMPSITPD